MYDILSSFWLLDAEVVGVVGGGEPVKSIDDDVGGGGADDDGDETGQKCAMELEDWTVDFNMSFLLGGIVKDVGNYGCGR